MKAIFFFLASACLFSGLAATSFDFPLEDEQENNLFENFLDTKNEDNLNDIIITFEPTRRPYPTSTVGYETSTAEETTGTTTTERTRPPRPRPTRPRPTRPSTTSTTTTTTTTTTPFPSTTSRPRPTRPSPTTPRPRPTRPFPTTTSPSTTSRPPRPFPPVKPPQIFRNIVDIQAPFASRLYNVVQNMKGRQNTRQRNEIEYNFRTMRNARRMMDEEEQE